MTYTIRSLDIGRPARRLRVDTLVRLRWLAVTGQCLVLVALHLGLGFPLPFMASLLVIGLSAALNVVLRLSFAVGHRFEDGPAMALLGYDVLQLSALLYLTGGLGNPFSMLFLAPVMISAASLPPARTLALGLLTAAAATALVFVHRAMPWFAGQILSTPFAYTAGVWAAIVSGTAFTGVYASRVAEESRLLSDALAATELALAREQHLSQLDGLAAAAAHELGTPLATITLVVRELIKSFPPTVGASEATQIREDLALLDQEVRRCRTILSKLASLDGDQSGPLQDMALTHLIEDVVRPHRDFGVLVTVEASGGAPEPVCLRNPGLIYGLGNLVENAVDFAKAEVEIKASWTREAVTLSIGDDGPGFPSDILGRVGDPYVTSRTRDRRAKAEDGAGLGLGLFIAKTLIERSGATMSVGNVQPPGSGARIYITWPRSAFERGRVAPPTNRIVLSAPLARLP